jgi:hypothetical protein
VFTYNSYTNEQFSSPQGEIGNSSNPFDFIKLNTMLKVKAGFLINNSVGINFAYVPKTGVSNDLFYQLNYSAAQIGIEYFLGRNK